MKVMFFTPYFRPYIGGIERFVDEVSLRLVGYKGINEVSIVTSNSLYKTGIQIQHDKFEIDRGRKIYRLNFFPKSIPFIYHSYNAGFFARELREVVQTIKPDIIHLCKFEWYIPNLYLCYISSCFPNKKIFFFSFHPKPLKIKHYPMILINKLIFNKVDFVHIPTKEIDNILTRLLKFPKEKISYIPLGITPNNKKRFNHNGINIINVGRFNERKGQCRLANLFLHLPTAIQEKCNLFFIGRDDGDLDQLKTLVKNKPNIKIFENIDDNTLHFIFRNGDIYATMSLDELFGLSIIEAMGFELAVIAYETIGNKGFIQNEKSGLIIKSGDEKSFKDNLLKLINNEYFRRSLAKGSGEFAKKWFTWNNTTSEIYNLYQE